MREHPPEAAHLPEAIARGCTMRNIGSLGVLICPHAGLELGPTRANEMKSRQLFHPNGKNSFSGLGSSAERLADYRTAAVLVPAAANTSPASASAMGMKTWTTSPSNWVPEDWRSRRTASSWPTPLR